MRECDETAEETKAQSTAQLVSGGRSVRALLPESQPALSWSGTKSVWSRCVANSHGSLIFLLGEKISDSDLNLTGVFSVGRNLQQKIIRRKNWAVLVSGARGREYFVVTPFQGCNQLHPNLE